MATVAGSGKFDAAGYVTASQDLLPKGETEQYKKLTDRTKAQAEQDYEDNIDSMMEGMGEVGLSDELPENYRTLYKDIYKKTLIGIGEMEKLMGKEQFRSILGQFVTKPHGKLTLVPESDRREAGTASTAQDDFMEV